jgi:hypothetical protein
VDNLPSLKYARGRILLTALLVSLAQLIGTFAVPSAVSNLPTSASRVAASTRGDATMLATNSEGNDDATVSATTN